jgi:hypothetical protein
MRGAGWEGAGRNRGLYPSVSSIQNPGAACLAAASGWGGCFLRPIVRPTIAAAHEASGGDCDAHPEHELPLGRMDRVFVAALAGEQQPAVGAPLQDWPLTVRG